MLRFMIGVGLTLLAASVAGCSSASNAGESAPNTGPPCATTPTFHDVLKKPLSSCSGFEPPCHNASAGYLSIDPMNAKTTYQALVNVPASEPGAGDRVVPGDPDSSFLYRKLTDQLGKREGDPMPKAPLLGPGGGGMWTELPHDQIEMVRCWIAGGAAED